MSERIDFFKLHEKAQIPTQATPGSYGYDLFAIEEQYIHPQSTGIVRTGLMVKLPMGIELQIRSRSGLAAKSSVFVLNAPATIDQDFFGSYGEDPSEFELKVILHNLHRFDNFVIKPGDRIAQAVPCCVPLCKIFMYNTPYYSGHSIESIPRDCNTKRVGGLGSTGVRDVKQVSEEGK